MIQLLKVLFGRNAANLNIKELRKVLPSNIKPPKGKFFDNNLLYQKFPKARNFRSFISDFLEALLLRNANNFTEFVVDSGRKDFYYSHLLM